LRTMREPPFPTEGDSALLVAMAGEALASKGPIVGRATGVDMMTRGSDGRWSVDSRHALAEGR